MKLNVAVLNPAGNITLLVTTPVNREDYAKIAGKLLDMTELRGEQVGFLTEPKQGGMVRLEMMGGEFCGNALRSVGYYHAVKSGAQRRTVIAAEISGCGNPLDVEVDLDNNTAKSQMPLPVSINTVTVNGSETKVVVFEGIVHFIAESPMSGGLPAIDEAFLEAAVEHAIDRLGAEAAGVMFFDRASGFIRPVVYVCATDSLVYENSCASGSTASALVMASDLPDGEYKINVQQPGGTIEVGITKSGGGFESLTIGGMVSIDGEVSVELQV